jgi:hypothetical protein
MPQLLPAPLLLLCHSCKMAVPLLLLLLQPELQLLQPLPPLLLLLAYHLSWMMPADTSLLIFL